MQKAVVDTYLTAACQQLCNQITNSGNGPAVREIPHAGIPHTNPGGSTKYSYTPVGLDITEIEKDLCGYYIVSPAPLAAETAFATMQANAIFAGEADIEKFIPRTYGGRWTGFLRDLPKMPSTQIQRIITAYMDKTKNFPDNPAVETSPPQVLQKTIREKFRRGTIDLEVANIMGNFKQWVDLSYSVTNVVIAPRASSASAAVSPSPATSDLSGPRPRYWMIRKNPRDDGPLSWVVYWPMLAAMVSIAAAAQFWLWFNLPGARWIKQGWAQTWGPLYPRARRVAVVIGRNRGKIWLLSLIGAAVLEIVRETVPGQSRVWSATYTVEAVGLLVAALLTISAIPGVVGMFFKPVTWQIAGWTFRMVWANLYQFGRYSVSAFVSYLLQFGWVNGRFDPLGDVVVAIIAAGKALMAVLRTGDLWKLLQALPPPAAGGDDNIVLSLEWLWVGLWRGAELLCLIVMARYAVAALIGLCRGLFHLIREHLQHQPIRPQTPHGPSPNDWETI